MGSGNSSGNPSLILLAGLPGSGKTTFARRLAARTAADHLESDAVRRQLAPNPTYTTNESAAVFAQVERGARAALQSGRHAIIDATNLDAKDRRRFVQLAERLGCPLIAVRLTASEELLRARLSAPRSGNSQADESVYEAMRGRLHRFTTPSIVVDSRFDPAAAVALLDRMLHDRD
jgi:hypothetical protein